MIKLKQILLENKINSAYDFLKQQTKGTEWEGKIYAVGGYARDKMLGLQPKDLDIMVNEPDGGIKFAEWITKKLGIYKTGSNPVIFPKFGTAKFVLYNIKHNGEDLSGLDIEAVMPRGEKYSDESRKPETFFTDLKTDALRRDLTINAMYQRLSDDEIIDLTGKGKEDLKNKLIRTPLDPDIIFSDDPLRMLRVIRFAVKYDFGIQLSTIRAIKKNAHRLDIISKERIQDELNKILLTKNPVRGIKLIKITGLLDFIAEELKELINLSQNKYHHLDAWKHSLEVLKNTPPDLITRISALLHDVGKGRTKTIVNNEIHFYAHENISADMAEAIMKRLKYPNDIINAVVNAIKNHMRLKPAGNKGEGISDKALRKLKRDLGDHLEQTLDLIHADNVSHADSASMPDQITNIRKRYGTLKDIPQTQHIKLPINGKDLQDMFGLKPGKELGDLLRQLEDEYMENPDITREEAIEFIKNKLEK